MRTGLLLVPALLLLSAIALVVHPVLAQQGVADHRESPYDPTLPVSFDAESMVYSYRGIDVAVRLDEDGEPVLPSPGDLGICDFEPDACAGASRRERGASPYDPAKPIVLEEDRGVYSYRGIEVAVRRDEAGAAVLPSPEDLGLCDLEPEACGDPGEEPALRASPYDPSLPVELDEDAGVYSYRGIECAVRRGEDGRFVLPTPEELGVCDLDPDECGGDR